MQTTKKDMMNILWGDCYYNKKKKVTTGEEYNKKGKLNKRCFCKFIMEPIIKVHKLCNEKNDEDLSALTKLLGKLDVTLTNKEWKQDGRKLSKTVM